VFHLSDLSSLHACIAMSPDEQLNILKDLWQKQKNVEIVMSKEENETIKYYLNEMSINIQYFILTCCTFIHHQKKKLKSLQLLNLFT